jgi:hypothetical protein
MPDPATVLAAIDKGLDIANKAADLALKVKSLFGDNDDEFDALFRQIDQGFQTVSLQVEELTALSRNILTAIDGVERQLSELQYNTFQLDIYQVARTCLDELTLWRNNPSEALAADIEFNSALALNRAVAFAPSDYAIGPISDVLAIRVRVIDELWDGAFAAAPFKAQIQAAVDKIDAYVASTRD